jgi:holo-[acyl-carrier protein] synthase
MIKGIGCDIVEIARLKEKLIPKILAPQEISVYEALGSEKRKKEYLAGRFAMKEAVRKAAGIIPFSEIVILNDSEGKPVLSCERLVGQKIHVSVSHETAYAVGLCVVEESGL